MHMHIRIHDTDVIIAIQGSARIPRPGVEVGFGDASLSLWSRAAQIVSSEGKEGKSSQEQPAGEHRTSKKNSLAALTDLTTFFSRLLYLQISSHCLPEVPSPWPNRRRRPRAVENL